MNARSLHRGLLLAALALLLLAACTGERESSSIIPPCTPVEGSDQDPCEDRAFQLMGPTGAGHPSPLPEVPHSIAAHLGDGTSIWVNQVIVRATTVPNTARCTGDNPFRPADHKRGELGGEGAPGILCFIDVRVNEYYVGSGPSRLSILFWRVEQYGGPVTSEQLRAMEGGDVGGIELIVFLGPSFDVGVQALQIFGLWKVAEKEDGTVVAVHPYRDQFMRARPAVAAAYASLLEMTLPAFDTAVNAAHHDRVGGL